jgi:MoxR-like ATPase
VTESGATQGPQAFPPPTDRQPPTPATDRPQPTPSPTPSDRPSVSTTPGYPAAPTADRPRPIPGLAPPIADHQRSTPQSAPGTGIAAHDRPSTDSTAPSHPSTPGDPTTSAADRPQASPGHVAPPPSPSSSSSPLSPPPITDAETIIATAPQSLTTPTRPAVPAAASAEAMAARQALKAVRAEVAKAVVGQDAAVTGMVIALLSQGHVLLEGVPGVAKTLLVRALSAAVSLDTKRVQFTPDLMPGDITGSLIYDARTAEFSFREGPVFTNLLLADEINRTPPKTQAALLEAMEERQVSVDGQPRMLPTPFLVAATQNPLEFEGTYPLPEAQLDRFLLKLVLPLPSRDEEIAVLQRHAQGFDPRDLDAAGVKPVAGAEQLAVARDAVRQVTVAPEVLAYIADLVRATRASTAFDVGVSPRGATALLQASRAWAWLSSRDYLLPDDVKALAKPVLRHRVRLRPEMELEGISADSVLDSILAAVVVPR